MRDYFRKCNQICRILRIWSHLLKKSLIENFIFCAVVFMPTCNNPLPKMTKIVMYRYVTLTRFYQKSSEVCFSHPWVKWRHLYNKWNNTVKVSWTIINHSGIKMFPPQVKTTVSTKILFDISYMPFKSVSWWDLLYIETYWIIVFFYGNRRPIWIVY